MAPHRVFPQAVFKTHMPFFDGQHLVFCASDAPRRHPIACRGEIWAALARRAELRRDFFDLPQQCDVEYRPWKLAYSFWPAGRVRRIETGLPPEAVECSPASYREAGQWHVSFVGGLPARHGWSYHLYKLSGPSLDQLRRAEKVVPQPVRAGFVSPRYLCTGGRRKLDLTDRIRGTRFSLACPLQSMFRVSYRADDLESLILSGVDDYGRNVTLLHRIDSGSTHEISSPADVYKPSLFARRLIFARRDEDGEEDRELWEGPYHLEPSFVTIRPVAV